MSSQIFKIYLFETVDFLDFSFLLLLNTAGLEKGRNKCAFKNTLQNNVMQIEGSRRILDYYTH